MLGLLWTEKSPEAAQMRKSVIFGAANFVQCQVHYYYAGIA